MRKEKSCGAIIFQDIDGVRLFLLIHMNHGHWSFPKGHMEPHETEAQTAVREIHEETGLRVTLLDGFRESITYRLPDEANKEVVFFLALAQSGAISIQKEELQDARWLTFPQALELITYPKDRDVLMKAVRFLG